MSFLTINYHLYDFKDLENTPSLPQSLDIIDILILLKSIRPLFQQKKEKVHLNTCLTLMYRYLVQEQV